MKFIGKLLLYILIALLVAIAGLYFLLQTRWGAEHISAWVSENSDYHLAFGAMDHRFSAPSHIVLENVTFGRDGQPATLVAKSVDIALSSRQLTEPRHVDTILLENGTLNLTDQTAPLPFKADRLQLRDMAFNSPNSEWKLSAQRVNGGVVPWSPKAGKVLGTKAQIQFSAGSLSLNDVPATNVLIEGSIDNDRVTLTNLGADIARGTLTGNAQRNADGSWQVENLRMADIRLQSEKSLTDFFAPLRSVPSLQIGRLEVIDARLQGPDWAVTDLDLSLRNMTFSKDDWQTQEGKLSMNASEFIYGSLHLFDPIINTEFSPQGVALRQFTSRWEGGMVRTSGNWLRDGKTLILDDAAIAGLEYTEKGILEATASVSQTPQRQTHISLNGRGVPVNILQQWGWPELPLTGDGNIQLTASGDIQANVPLKPTVSGQLHAVNAAKQQVTQTMNAGIVSSGEVTSTEPVR